MSHIILDARRLKAYEDLKYLGEFTGKDAEFINKLWDNMLLDQELFEEFLYYIDNQTLLDKYKFKGYSLTDLYVYVLERYNLMIDIGKNDSRCVKEVMVLDTFNAMIELKKNPDAFIKRMNNGDAYDRLN